MKLLNKIFTIVNLSLGLVIISSCEDFVTEQPIDTLTVEQFYDNDAQLTQAIGAGYTYLGDNLYRRGFYQMFLENRTDAMMLGLQTRAGADLDIATFNYNPSNSRIVDLWTSCYRAIKNMNVLIAKAPLAKNASESVKNSTLAEAHFLRAFYYFQLVRLWGEVPLVTVQAQTFGEAQNAPRAPVNTIYEQIIQDAKIAAGETTAGIVLRATTANDGRVGVSAAHTLLADVYLTLKNYSEAARYAKLVIDSGNHALWENYADAFDISKQYLKNSAPNAENIFDAKFNPDVDPGSRFANFAWPSGMIIPYGSNPNQRGQGFFEVTQSSFDKLENGDNRKIFMFPGTFVLGAGNESIRDPAATKIVGGAYNGKELNKQSPYFVFKYSMVDPRNRFGWANNPWPIYRYADVLLMYVEALNEIGGATQEVLDQTINLTRARGGLAPLIGVSGAALRDAIKQERYTEFFFEGKRFFDLVRWGDLVNAVNSRDFGYGTVITIDERYHLMPLPQIEIDANPSITTNNAPWN